MWQTRPKHLACRFGGIPVKFSIDYLLPCYLKQYSFKWQGKIKTIVSAKLQPVNLQQLVNLGWNFGMGRVFSRTNIFLLSRLFQWYHKLLFFLTGGAQYFQCPRSHKWKKCHCHILISLTIQNIFLCKWGIISHFVLMFYLVKNIIPIKIKLRFH